MTIRAGLAFAANGRFKTRGHVGFLEPIEHQLGGQEHGDRVDLVLTGIFWRRAVGRFEHRVVIAKVCAGQREHLAGCRGCLAVRENGFLGWETGG